MTSSDLQTHVKHAADVVREGGVIAYPTEYCFGLGCDPENSAAIQRILRIKQRRREQGLILIAADLQQVEYYADLAGLEQKKEIMNSWPGPNTWLLPKKPAVSNWVSGEHKSVAMRIPQHEFCLALCRELGHALISTSANRHGQDALLNAEAVAAEMQDELDYLVPLAVGNGQQASTIRDAMTGDVLR